MAFSAQLRRGAAWVVLATVFAAFPLGLAHAHETLHGGDAFVTSCAVCALAHAAGVPERPQGLPSPIDDRGGDVVDQRPTVPRGAGSLPARGRAPPFRG